MKSNPIIVLCGEAGSGKDTAGKFIQELVPRTITLAQAAPLKDLGRDLFHFTEDQLYGPSESRNAPDHRFDSPEIWTEMRWNKPVIKAWLDKNFPDTFKAETLFNQWFDKLWEDTYVAKRTLTPRLMLQTLGTEFGRAIDPDVWSNIALRTCKEKLLNGEADLMVITDGRFKNEILNAKEQNAMAVLVMVPDTKNEAEFKKHASEAQLKSIPLHWYTEVIVNMKQLGMDFYRQQMIDFVETHIKVKANGMVR